MNSVFRCFSRLEALNLNVKIKEGHVKSACPFLFYHDIEHPDSLLSYEKDSSIESSSMKVGEKIDYFSKATSCIFSSMSLFLCMTSI
jgi:hypothetical protein